MTVIDIIMMSSTMILGLMTIVAVVWLSLYWITHDYKARKEAKKRAESRKRMFS